MRSSAASPSSQTHDATPVVPTAALDASKLEEKFAAVNGDFTRGVTIKGKDDAMKLQGKVNDWRDDVSTLATHIAAQLQFCKSLRTSKAMALIPNTTPGDSDSQARMKEILDAPSTLDKTGGDPTVAFDTLLKVILFVMAKGDMVSKIADDFVSKKKEVDMNNGIEDELVLDDHSATSMLLSRDTKLFTKLLDTFQMLYKESRKPSNTQTPQSGDDSGGLFASTTAADSEGAKGLRMDEANFTIQKLEDEIRTSANALAELRLNVDLITNMYKKTCDDVVAYDKQKSVVADERDILGQKLHDEVKKISILNLMCAVLKREVSEKGAAIDTLRGNIVELQTGHEERMLEKTKRHEEGSSIIYYRFMIDDGLEFDKLLVKFDKTKKELVETVQDNIISLTMYILYLFDIWKYVFAIYICICLIYVKYVSLNLVHILDGKLRAAHDRISRFLS
ncbi:hypothetical protein DYB37_001318 [Aphanomyces astaci]|uniref:Uncharacterized protein n=1 Tax=Aphanomyces astaci TaxID=112090 RepID=A0A3R7AEA1_APHAT|nr:hypothetical protein DYB35_001210 [Aphanomyces astaci]RHZ23243.1 hypothetical protein DYB37_001318 [Aphanomyces astaci]